MSLLYIENLSKSYDIKELFQNISFEIKTGDKIGVIGINGTGKSTMLKIIAGKEKADSGKIIGNMRKIEYLSQNPNFNSDITVIEQIFKGDSPVMELIREYESVLKNLELNPQDERLQKELVILSQRMDAQSAWKTESDAKTVLTKLGVYEFEAKIGTLSGGERKRVALAEALITQSDLLILDEPTNHLDSDTIQWLEEYLRARKGALIMVTHDRYFLDRVANRIIELDRGNLYSYNGNYSEFLEGKAQRLEIESANENKRQNLLRKELAWIRKGAKARSTKQKARIDRFNKLNEEKAETESLKVEILAGNSRLGKKVIELNNIKKSFGDKILINDFSYNVLRNDRVGIAGANGCGKSTLMNLIYGNIIPDSGSIEKGKTVKIGYYSQETSHMNDNMRVIEYVREAGEFIPIANGEKISASSMLENFLFSSSDSWNFIGKLSGGEKRRLNLIRVLMGAPNVLLFDEPTNDLDVETLAILEDYLDNFQGAVIAVSHDRYFLDRLADKIFVFEGEGKITQYLCNYSDYYKKKIDLIQENKIIKKDESKKKTKNMNTKEKPLKFTFKEKIEFEEIDMIIENIEQQLIDIENKINSAGSDFELLQNLTCEKEVLDEELEQKMQRWTYLNEKAEQMN